MTAVLLLAAAAAGVRGAEPVHEEDLRPGLVATYRDTGGREAVEVFRLDPIIALGLEPGEAPHPRLKGEGGTARWDGSLHVLRAGPYRFSARLRGRFRLTVAGKLGLEADAAGKEPALVEGPECRLEAGILPLSAEFLRHPSGSARLELFWQAPHFRREPIPYDHLGHLPVQAPARLAVDRQIERGRLLVEQRNCVRCHRPAADDRMAAGLPVHLGPDLSRVGERDFPGWIYHWLAAPHKLRPGALMPVLFGDDDAGRVERHAVAHYLASLGGPVKTERKPPDRRELQSSVNRGQRLFTTLGCAACHPAGDRPSQDRNEHPASFLDAPRSYPISGLGSKTTPEKLASYLSNPLAVDPSGRMPSLLLQGDEARDLARYLCESRDADVDAELPPAPQKEQLQAAFRRLVSGEDAEEDFEHLAPDARLLDLGKRLVVARGCTACHNIQPAGQPLAATRPAPGFDELKKTPAQARGCLADHSSAGVPWFDLDQEDRECVRLFLARGTAGAGSPAPSHAARVAMQRLNCLACHTRDGEGGLAAPLVEELRRSGGAETDEGVSPPPLTGVGHKLRTPWLKQVLTQSGRARPWMGLRMPQFGEPNVGRLPEQLAVLEGAEPNEAAHPVDLTPAGLEAGRRMVGKQGFGCISCHDVLGIASTGARGPDLVSMTQRVRYDWYRRWLQEAQRIQPGTRMPIVFPEGRSLLHSVLDGSADAQADALWGYLSLGPNLPLPEGIGPPRGLVVSVADRPVILRSFMPEAGNRAVAVGFPGGVSAVFDPLTCRLAYAWSGNFLDAGPIWEGRGGSLAKVLGPRFWTAPPGCPLATTESGHPPDFAARSKDPAYGAPLPEGQLYRGPRQLVFEGYSAGKDNVPAFHYRVDAAEKHPLGVSEEFGPLRNPSAVGLARRLTLEAPAGWTAWLLAGESGSEPRLLDSQGATKPLDLKSGTTELPAAGKLLVLTQSAGRPLVLSLAEAPAGASWYLSRPAGVWQVLLRIPPAAQPAGVQVHLDLWSPYGDGPALLKELVARSHSRPTPTP